MEEREANLSSLTLLSKCPSNKISKLLHSIVDGVCDKKTSVSYEDFSGVWPSRDEWWSVTAALKDVVQRAIKHGSWTMDELTTMLGDSVSVEVRRAIHDCLEVRSQDIRQVFLENTCAVGGPILTDFDWQLKLVLGSDKVANVREPLASVSLRILDERDKERNVLLEMNKDELSTLIASLESARKIVNQLQT